MIVAHAVHWLVALPAAVVVAGLAVATFVEARRARLRGPAVLRDDNQSPGQPASAAEPDAGSTSRPPGPS